MAWSWDATQRAIAYQGRRDVIVWKRRQTARVESGLNAAEAAGELRRYRRRRGGRGRRDLASSTARTESATNWNGANLGCAVRNTLHNLGLKVLALAISDCGGWCRAIRCKSVVTAHRVSSYLTIADDYDSPFEVRVAVSGLERIVQDGPVQVNAVIGWRASSRRRTFDLDEANQHREGEGRARTAFADHIDFNPSAATVEVRPRVIGTFVSGYGITDVTADPTTIMIEGPANRASRMAITDPVDATECWGGRPSRRMLMCPIRWCTSSIQHRSRYRDDGKIFQGAGQL